MASLHPCESQPRYHQPSRQSTASTLRNIILILPCVSICLPLFICPISQWLVVAQLHTARLSTAKPHILASRNKRRDNKNKKKSQQINLQSKATITKDNTCGSEYNEHSLVSLLKVKAAPKIAWRKPVSLVQSCHYPIYPNQSIQLVQSTVKPFRRTPFACAARFILDYCSCCQSPNFLLPCPIPHFAYIGFTVIPRDLLFLFYCYLLLSFSY